MKTIADHGTVSGSKKVDPTVDDRIVDPTKPIGMPKLPSKPAPLGTKYPAETSVKPQQEIL